MSSDQLLKISLAESDSAVISESFLGHVSRTTKRRVDFASRKICIVGIIVAFITCLTFWVASQETDPRYSSKCQQTTTGPTEITTTITGSDPKETLFYVGVNNFNATKSNLSLVSSVGMTSARTSVFFPLRRSYEVGETVAMRIQAYDEQGQPKQTGGDFWYVLAASPDNQFRSVARVVDHRNGSYSAFFVAPEVGTIHLKVTLVHPSRTVRWLREVYMQADGCFTWGATYTGAGLPPMMAKGHGRCVVKGGLNHFQHANLCFYGANETGLGESALICTKPEGYRCEDITQIATYHQRESIELPVDKLLKGRRFLFNDTYFMVPVTSSASVSTVEIKVLPEMVPGLYEYLPPRPVTKCGHGDERGQSPLPEGYWHHNKWHSLICARKTWASPKDVRNCLAGHKIVMFGDSIGCQWFRILQEKLGKQKVTVSSYAQNCQGSSDRDLVYYRHILWSALSGASNFFGEERIFEPERIDRLNESNTNYILVFSMSAHYASWNMDSYRDRLRAIRQAIVRMRIRLGPERVMTVIKKSQPRDHVNFHARIHSNDYVFYEMSEIMEEEFAGIDAKLIDVWDMVLSFNEKTVVHMPWPCVREEVDLFLTYVCPG